MGAVEECGICYDAAANKLLPCKHSLCAGCFGRLVAPMCPFCRGPFGDVSQAERPEVGWLGEIDELIARLERLLPPPPRRKRRRQLSEVEILARRAKIRARQQRHREHQGRFYAKRWWQRLDDN